MYRSRCNPYWSTICRQVYCYLVNLDGKRFGPLTRGSRIGPLHALAFALNVAANVLTAQTPDPALPAYQATTQVSGAAMAVTGMDSVEAMMAAWDLEFRKHHPAASITIEQQKVAPEERIALGPDLSEIFRRDTSAYVDRYGCEPFRIKICRASLDVPHHLTAIGILVNPTNPIDHLSLAQLDAIYSDERRRGAPHPALTWGQLGATGSWADKPIHAYGFYWRDDITSVFKESVLLGSPFNSRYRVPFPNVPGEHTAAVAKAIMKAIADDPSAIAYANLSYRSGPVKTLALSAAGEPAIAPTAASVASGIYPLGRFIYLYVNRKPGQPLDPLFKEFLTFILSRDGQAFVGLDHYLPLSAAVAAAERAKLK
jgi:phosphate transport system substrate-binding protein